jgi:CDP-6-deoxy-D-xylo-4-hexulose-3-dehydrase
VHQLSSLSLASSSWGDEEIAAIHSVIESGKFSMGEVVKEFEKAFANHFNAKYALMVNSGSSANLALLAGMRYRNPKLLEPGSEIIVPAVSWSTTFFPIHQMGYKLKFVDIDPFTLNIDTKEVESAINKNTGAVLAVNLLGNPAELGILRDITKSHGLVLLEDNCESMGAKLGSKDAGTFGLGGTFSTFFSHHLCTMEGGITLTDDEELMETMLSVRAHGWTRELPQKNSVYDKSGTEWDDLFRFVIPGYNLRPLEIEAAIGLVQLKKLNTFVEMRRKNAEYLLRIGSQIPGFQFQREIGKSSWFGFSVILTDFMVGKRQYVLERLSRAGIQTRPIVAGNFTRNPVIKHLNHAPLSNYPSADLVHMNGFFFGNHHYDISSSLDEICEILSQISKEEFHA